MYQDFEGDPKVVRLVLERTVTRVDVIRHGVSQDWLGAGVQERAPGKLFQYAWRTGGGEARVSYIEDEDFGFAYLEVWRGSAEALEREVAAVRADWERVPVIEDEAVGRWFAAGFREGGTHDERLDAIFLVGLTSPKVCDPAWMGYYEAAAGDPDPDVRRAALWAMTQTGWPEFLPLVARLAEQDPDAQARDTAEGLRDALRRRYGSPAVGAPQQCGKG